MIRRKEYLQRLLLWKDDRVIKVITGLRRCGKSTLLTQFQEELQSSGVAQTQIISVNFEELEYEELLDYRKLYDHLIQRIDPGRMNYIFLDEIQRVPSYEKVVDSLYVKEYIDIYITGSNSYMLSGELATLLAGRYIEIKMLPLSFREFYEVVGGTAEQAFSEYLKIGGLPYVVTADLRGEKANPYLEGIYNTVIVKDIEERQSRRERDPAKRRLSDIALLRSIAKYLASVVGSPVSVRSVANYLVSNGRSISPNTVADYIDALCEAFLFYEAERFDIAGKELLRTNKKLYMADLGLRSHILPKKNYDLGFSVENIVFLELFRRGCQINIGKLGDAEVDFIARKESEIVYYQVTADMTAEAAFVREMRPLKQIRDNYEKIVLTLDRYTPGNYEGIKVINVLDWLLQT